MKKPFILDILLVASLGIICVAAITISNLSNQNRILKEEIKHQKTINEDVEYENDALQDALEEREMEVRYWGMKYDSIKQLH